MSHLWFGDDIVPLPENNENFLYFLHKSENPNTTISVVKFPKFDPSCDITKSKLG